MTTTSQEVGFTLPNFDWDLYCKYRPTYPASLYTRIHDYHRIAAEALAQRFDTVAVSDRTKTTSTPRDVD
ncbi:MAG: hypothetical protein Q9222_002143 [Ikaeria aurantiellina]